MFQRRDILKAFALLPLGGRSMTLKNLSELTNPLAKTERMPVFFIGHGNPMNAILDNPFAHSLAAMSKSVGAPPKAILIVSAHWLTRGTFVNVNPKPETIHDFGGFPQALFDVKYPAPGAPEIAREVPKLATEVREDMDWGLDHGAWSILTHLYPEANIPVFQLSIDYHQPMQYHFDLAKKLGALRNKGVLIIGSGNIVHNLRMYFENPEVKAYDWAVEFDTYVKERIDARDFQSLIDFEKQGAAAKLSVPTVDHYVPMIYALGLAEKNESINYTFEGVEASMSMRAFRIG
jgi:4,5-DOPA dioxygenase extradiol